MPTSPMVLADNLRDVGKAAPLVGDCTLASGMSPLGATEGPIVETGLGGATINGFTVPEHTGGLLHRATTTPGAVSVGIPLIVGDPDLWSKMTPTGSADGPPDNPIPVVTTSLMLVSLTSFPVTAGSYGPIGYTGTTWTPTGLDTDEDFLNSILFGMGFFTHGDVGHPFENGGKSIVPATYTPLYDPRLPAGKRGWIRGNPVAKGFTTFRL